MSGGLPNLINAGVTKAGTTSLFGYLGQHPDICIADEKDLNHFSPWRFGATPTESLADYAAHFAHCSGQRYRLDASPDYFTGGEPLVRALDAALPDARVVIVLRDPVKRLWSSYTYKKARGALPDETTFREVFEADLAARLSGFDRTREGEHHRTLSTGFYLEHLQPWVDQLGERCRVVFLEQLAADPAGRMREVFSWLDIDTAVADRLDYDTRNPTIHPRSRGVQRLAHAVNTRADAIFRRLPRLESALRGVYSRVNAGDLGETFDREDRQRVAELYADATRELGAYLRERGYHDLPGWCAS